ncbi:MAG: hypothetical protein WBB39_04310 [Candidatus Saccharimonadales bacterium]
MADQVGDGGGEAFAGLLADAQRRLDEVRFEHGAQTAEVRAGTTIADRMGAAVKQAELTLAKLYGAEAERLNELFATGDVPLEQMIEQAFGLAASTVRDPEELAAARAATEQVLPRLQTPGTQCVVFADGDMRVHTTTFPACLGVNPHLSGGVVLILHTDEYFSSPRHLSPQLVEVEPGRIVERYTVSQGEILEALRVQWERAEYYPSPDWPIRCARMARIMQASGIPLDDEARLLAEKAHQPLHQYVKQVLPRIAAGRITPFDGEFVGLCEAVDELRYNKPEMVEMIIGRIVAGYTDQIEYVKPESYVPLLTPIIAARDGVKPSGTDLKTMRGQADSTKKAIDLLENARDRSEYYQGE